MAQFEDIIDKFKNPNEKLREYLPVPFFFLNNDLPEDEIEWVMDNLAAQHFGGVFMHPRTGLEVEFLSDAFFERYEKFMAKCKEHNMDMWLYDEYNWPSGPVAGVFNRKYPEYLAKGLIYYKESIKEGKKFKWHTEIESEELYFITIIPKDSSADPEETITIPPSEYRSANHHKRIEEYGIDYGDDQRSLIINKAPCSGDIYIFCLNLDIGIQFSVVCSPKVEPARGYIDGLNKDAVKKFIEMSYDKFKEKLGHYFGKEIKGIFTDEPAFYAGMMWTSKLPKKFMQKYNYSFFSSFHLYFEKTAKSPRFKKDYHELVEEMYRDNFAGELRYWCDQNNLALTGHLLMEENGYTNGVYLWGSAHKALSPFTIPGIDYLGDTFSPNFKRQYSIMGISAKLIHSVQVLTGAKRTLCEAFGGSTWKTDIATYKNGVNFLTIQGVNLINPHAVHFSIKGLRKRDFPNSYFVQQPYYPYFHHANDYTARSAYLNSIGVHDTKVMVLFPDIHQKIVNQIFNTEKEVKNCARGFYTLLNFLLSSQFDPDLLFESTIVDELISSDETKPISMGNENYSTVFIPPLLFIRYETLEFLLKIFNNGGKVIFVGSLPVGSENGWVDEKILSFFEEMFDQPLESLKELKDAVLKGNDKGGIFAYLPIKLPISWQKIINQFKSIYHLIGPENLKSIQIISGDEPHKIFVSKRVYPDLNKNFYFIANISKRTNEIKFRCFDFGEVFVWDLNDGTRKPFLNYEINNKRKYFTVNRSFGGGEMLVLEVNLSNDMRGGKKSTHGAKIIKLPNKWTLRPHTLNTLVLKKWYYNPIPIDAWPKGRVVPVPTKIANNFFKMSKGWLTGAFKLIFFLFGLGGKPKIKKLKIGTYSEIFGDLDVSVANRLTIPAFGRNLMFIGSYGLLLEFFRPFLHKINMEHFVGELNLFYGQEFVCFTRFKIKDMPNILKLAYEDLGEPIEIYVNKKKIPPGEKDFIWDKCNRVVDIKKYVVPGRNLIAIRTRKPKFQDWWPSMHALEPVVLIGNFGVKKDKMFKPKSPMVSGLKDWKKYGFPQYKGAFSYEQKQLLDRPSGTDKVYLEISNLRNMVAVEVNGQDCGFVDSPPWRIDITEAVIDGENSIKIDVFNTCENLLGKPRKSGLFGKVLIRYIG